MKKLTLLFALPLLAGTPAGGDDLLENALSYIRHLEKAETLINREKTDEALAELEKALAVALPNSQMKQMKILGTGAAAHFQMARAHAIADNADLAMESLEKAAANGWSSKGIVRKDPAFESLRERDDWAELMTKFRPARRKDKFSGQLVKDQKVGMGLVRLRRNNYPKVGEPAPNFNLALSDSEETLQLSSFHGRTPVVLVFGSYT